MPRNMTVACPACQAPAEVSLERLIDVKRRPQLKAALLSGQLNNLQCSACGAASALAAPILYHDAGNEMLIAFVPPELNLQAPQRDQVMGDMLKELTASIPKEEFRGYMFQPKQALTLQGLVEQIMEGDGVTQEMMEEQRARFTLLDTLVQAKPDRLRTLLRKHDAEIDAGFFQAALVMMQQAAQDGQENLVNTLAAIQEAAAQHSSFGKQMTTQAEARDKIVQDVTRRIQALGDSPERKDLLALALDLAQDEQRLQALVGLLRPAFDYPFFQELTLRIGQAPVAERTRLEALRDRLGELTRMADAQAQAALQQATVALQAIMASADTDKAIREHISIIDESFMTVLAANIREAEKRANIQASSRLKVIHQKIVALMQEKMEPELRFVNELLGASDQNAALAVLDAGLQRFGEALPDMLEAVERMLRQQGQEALARKLETLRGAAKDRLRS